MHQRNVERLGDYLRAQGAGGALLARPATITWLTGYAAPVGTGPSPFDGGPALAWYVDGEIALLVGETEKEAVASTGAAVFDYVDYSVGEPLIGMQRQCAALRSMLAASGLKRGTVAIEAEAVTVAQRKTFDEAMPGVTVTALDPLALDSLRAVKTTEEIEKIRAALELADLAQATLERDVRAGVSELDLWSGVLAAMERAAGQRLAVLLDLVAGGRSADIGGPPGPRMIAESDPVLADVVPRLDGYWGDNCGVHVAGTASRELKRVYEITYDILRQGVAAVRPGVRACDLDALLRAAVRDAGYEPYPHHSGHGLGATYHDEPRIVPYNEMVLEPGMVIDLEPGIYLEGRWGVRLEDAVLVTEDGCEILTRHLDRPAL
jgi:Xaa-Pro aminopeptidase